MPESDINVVITRLGLLSDDVGELKETFAVERVVWAQLEQVADDDLPGFNVLTAWDTAWAAA